MIDRYCALKNSNKKNKMADRFAEGNNILIHSLKDNNYHLQKKLFRMSDALKRELLLQCHIFEIK